MAVGSREPNTLLCRDQTIDASSTRRKRFYPQTQIRLLPEKKEEKSLKCGYQKIFIVILARLRITIHFLLALKIAIFIIQYQTKKKKVKKYIFLQNNTALNIRI